VTRSDLLASLVLRLPACDELELRRIDQLVSAMERVRADVDLAIPVEPCNEGPFDDVKFDYTPAPPLVIDVADVFEPPTVRIPEKRPSTVLLDFSMLEDDL